MIKGYFDQHGAPMVDCRISIPIRGIQNAPLTMLVSTGTPFTTLLPEDAERIGVLRESLPSSAGGVPVLKGVLTFPDEEKPGGLTELEHRLPVMNPFNTYLPAASVLGWDILQKWRIYYNYQDRNLTLTPPDQAPEPEPEGEQT